MQRATKCKWCGRGVRANGKIIAFLCFTSVVDDCWSQSPECKLKGVEDRISRVLKILKTADRRYVSNGFASYVDSRDVDEVIKILERKDES